MQNTQNNFEKSITNEIIQPLRGKKSKKTNNFISNAINLFKSGDDMTALSTLYDLTTQLSMANDTLAEDPNCPFLIQELILLFDKYFLPDIALFSLQCINYLLDLNPIFTSTIQQHSGIPKIILMTQNIEFIDLAENAIKAIEKISSENSLALLESDAFVNVLNFIDFFDNNIKRCALRSCLNMTYSVNSYEKFKKYIVPAIPSLSSLSKISQNEISITSLSIQCFYSILTNIKTYTLIKDESFENSLIQYGMLENIYEITLIYINSNNGKTIGTDVFRNVLKIYQMLCSFNSATSVLLNMNILEILYFLLQREIGNVEGISIDRKMSSKDESVLDNHEIKEDSNKMIVNDSGESENSSINVNVSNKRFNDINNNSHTIHSFLNEIFSILMALFPSVKIEECNNDKESNSNGNEIQDKLIAPSNRIFYKYFADKILKLLLSNILSISSCSTLIQIVKLLSLYLNFSQTEQIVNNIEAEKLSNILGKLLDTKDTYYLSEVINLIEITMKKSPEHFIVFFIREGIVENLKTFKLEKLENIEKMIEQSKTEKLGIDSTRPIYDHNGIEEDREVYSEDDYMIDNNNDDYNYESQSEESNSKESPETNYQAELERAIEMSKSINEEAKIEIIDKKEKMNEIKNIIPSNKNDVNSSSDITNDINRKEDFIDITNNIELINVANVKEKLVYNPNKDIVKKEINEVKNTKDNSRHIAIDKTKLDDNNIHNYSEDRTNKVYNSISPGKITIVSDADKNSFNSYIYQYPELETLQLLRKRLESLVKKFFTEEKIEEYLNKNKKLRNNPMNMYISLQNYKNEINSILENRERDETSNEINKLTRCIEILKKVMEIILNKETPLTLWEIEKSDILLAITKFFDKNFIKFWNDTSEDRNEISVINSKLITNKKDKSSISANFLKTCYDNPNFIQKLKSFYSSCLDSDLDKILNFVKILQHTITTMNCFTIFLNENNLNYNINNMTKNLASKISRSAYKEKKKYRIKFRYDRVDFDKNFLQDLKNSNFSLDLEKTQFDKILELNNFLEKKKETVITLSSEELFSDIEKIFKDDLIFMSEKLLIKKSFKQTENSIANKTDETNHITDTNNNFNLNEFILNNLSFNFFMSFDIKGEKRLFLIDKNWTTNDILENLKKNFTKEEISEFLIDIPIIYELKFKQYKTNFENEIQEKNNSCLKEYKENAKTESDLISDINNDSIFSEILKNKKNYSDSNILIEISEKLFIKFYNDNILKNKNLYQIKRLAPSLYLVALIELSLQFSSLFGISLVKSSVLEEKLVSTFENQKVSSLLFKQLRDPSAISYSSVPLWCKSLPENFTFMSNFNSRYLLFKTCSFDARRGLINLHNYLKKFSGESTEQNNNSINISKNSRFKVIVERNDILSSAIRLMKENAGYNGFVQFEYLNETGTGLGPTLEFYSLVIEKLTTNKNLWYKNSTNNKLFPAPVRENSENFEMFKLLGFIIARALYDDRLIDIPLSPIFWNLLLDRPITLDGLYEVDSNLANTIVRDLIQIMEAKKKFFSLPENSRHIKEYLDPENENFDLGEKIKYNDVRIDELAILFNLPGYPEIELVPNGLETILTIHNIEDYVIAIYDNLFGSGVKSLLNTFKTGFNLVFDVENLKCFHAKEIEESLCGSAEMIWDHESLYEHVRPDHGYDKTSRIYQYLLKFMNELDKNSKRNFLTFVTGSPRLPVGGFKSLIPKLTVVKAISHNPLEKIDNILPTVMTCQNYLKIPEYSSYEIFRDRLSTAIREGLNAFLFS